MKIQVLGSGCPTCKKLYEVAQEAVHQLGINGQVEYLTGQEGIQKMIDMGAMYSPVLAINGKPAIAGPVKDVDKIKKVIQEARRK